MDELTYPELKRIITIASARQERPDLEARLDEQRLDTVPVSYLPAIAEGVGVDPGVAMDVYRTFFLSQVETQEHLRERDAIITLGHDTLQYIADRYERELSLALAETLGTSFEITKSYGLNSCFPSFTVGMYLLEPRFPNGPSNFGERWAEKINGKNIRKAFGSLLLIGDWTAMTESHKYDMSRVERVKYTELKNKVKAIPKMRDPSFFDLALPTIEQVTASFDGLVEQKNPITDFSVARYI